MIDPLQLLAEVIRPVLRSLDLWSNDAERLVLGTACQESACGRNLVQYGGPALGIYQMEPATHLDILTNYLASRPVLMKKVEDWGEKDWEPRQLIWNLAYATAFCRLQYARDPDPIPDTLSGQAAYWKRVYNTPGGAGTEDQYLTNWRNFVGNKL